MPDKEGIANEFDGPWKVALEIYLRDFLQLSFPVVHDLIDWTFPPEFLDTELHQLGPAHEQGVLAVDRLVKVRMRSGQFEWLFIHVEVQAQRQREFGRRMFTYHYRIGDKFGQPVISLAVLADGDPTWLPSFHETTMAGCRLWFEFPVFKVVAMVDPAEIFARTGNSFALVVAAHQVALATSHHPDRRYAGRLSLFRHLVAMGMERGKARDLWKLIHLLTRLPRDMELKFQAETTRVQRMSINDLMTPLEEIAKEEGRREECLRLVLRQLQRRVGPLGSSIESQLSTLSLERLESLAEALLDFASIGDLTEWMDRP